MRMNDAFPNKWLKAEDIDGDLIVTISEAYFEEFTDPKTQQTDQKPVLCFSDEDAKPLILNKTNFTTISKVLGSDDTDDWTGKQITLYATEVEAFGEVKLGIRVRLRAPEKAKAAKAPKTTASKATSQQVDAEDIPF